jgi:hypothetical protein
VNAPLASETALPFISTPFPLRRPFPRIPKEKGTKEDPLKTTQQQNQKNRTTSFLIFPSFPFFSFFQQNSTFFSPLLWRGVGAPHLPLFLLRSIRFSPLLVRFLRASARARERERDRERKKKKTSDSPILLRSFRICKTPTRPPPPPHHNTQLKEEKREEEREQRMLLLLLLLFYN